jgi:iron(III) transport system substrate-binding protein
MCAVATNAGAQSADVAALAAYASPDRAQKLAEGARREGTLNLYSSLTTEDLNILGSAFEKKYGVKPTFWRASNEDILQRAAVEARGGRQTVDLYETGAASLEGLRRENLLQPVVSPVFADLMPQATAPGAWIGTRLQIITAAYNTNAVRASALPKSYADLADPKWKGKLAIEAGDTDWLATLITALGGEPGEKLLRQIVATNGVSVRKGHTLIANLVAAGEAPVAITTYLYKVNQLKAAGAPIDAFQLDPTVARVDGVGLAASAPHPNAALLFMDFMLGEGQAILAGREFFPTNLKAGKSLAGMKLAFSDAGKQLDESERWQKLYNDIFGRRSR